MPTGAGDGKKQIEESGDSPWGAGRAHVPLHISEHRLRHGNDHQNIIVTRAHPGAETNETTGTQKVAANGEIPEFLQPKAFVGRSLNRCRSVVCK